MKRSVIRESWSPTMFLFLALLLIAGCGDTSVATEPDETSQTAPAPPPPPPPPTTPPANGSLLIEGVMTPQDQGLRVSRGGAPVTDAEVIVNGVPIPHCCGDLYWGHLPGAVPAGGTLNLKVVAGGLSFEALGEVIATPTIIAPAAGSTFAWTDTVSLAWSIPTDPDRFDVCLNCWEYSLDGATYTVPGSAREFTIAPGDLRDYGGGAVVAVYAFKNNFLKSAGSRDATSDVLFMARSRDALITIKR